mmetsp:Transcript_39753/g.96009  ORF Transcript_39753/g.96009 Transcript_39753/m.96009 type:complete len:255 (-) Transcript_39753:95-859(-)
MMPKRRQCSLLSVLGIFIFGFCISNFILQPSLEQSAIGLPGLQKVQLPRPILVVGMPKVGTSSIYEFFKCNGIKSSHYCCCGSNRTHTHCGDGRSFSDCMRQNAKSNRKILEGCGDYDVYAQMDGEAGNSIYLPQHFALDSIHEYSPNATWILNLRNAAEWVSSVTNWYGLGGRFLRRFKVDIKNKNANRTKALIDIFDNHVQTVRDFVRTHPTHHLIELDIKSKNAGKILAHEFSLNEGCWGNHNQNPRRQSA